MKRIESYQELLDYAVACLDSAKALEPAEISDNLDFNIKIKGPSWDGAIDYRIAKYVIDIQNAVNKLLIGHLGKEDLSAIKKEFIVKFKVEKGCSIIEVKFSETIKAFINNMSGRQKLAIGIILILAIASFFTVSSLLDYKKAIETKKMDEATKVEIVKVLDKVLEKMDVAEKPARGLVSKLQEEDTIRILAADQELPAVEAKKIYPRKPPLKTDYAYIDDDYIIKDIIYGENVFIVIEKGAHTVKCGAALNRTEIDRLYAQLREKHNEGKIPFTLPLKVTAKYTEREIKEATIIGIGSKRDDAQNISSLVKTP